jgi:hypothetical protein
LTYASHTVQVDDVSIVVLNTSVAADDVAVK